MSVDKVTKRNMSNQEELARLVPVAELLGLKTSDL